MADPALTSLSGPDDGAVLPGPALSGLLRAGIAALGAVADEESRLKSHLMDDIFGAPQPAPPLPMAELCGELQPRAPLRTSIDEEPAAAHLQSVALNLEHALSGIFDEVESAAAVSNGQVEAVDDGQPAAAPPPTPPPPPPPAPAATAAPPAAAAPPTAPPAGGDDDDDDIVVLDEISVPVRKPGPASKTKDVVTTEPATKRRGLLLGPACRRRQVAAAAAAAAAPRKLLGPASKRKDSALLGLPSSRMPRDDDWDSDSEMELNPANLKQRSEARSMWLNVNMRLNNVCMESSQTVRQWAVAQLQRKESRKRYWEEVRRGPRPPPPQRRASRPGRGRTKQPAAAAHGITHTPVNFAASKQLLSLISRGVVQMTSVGAPAATPAAPKVNGNSQWQKTPLYGRQTPTAAYGRGRGRVMVQIPSASLSNSRGGLPQARQVTPQSRSGGSRVLVKQTSAVANLAAIPDLGDKQRNQLMKLLQGNNGTSISPALPEGKPREQYGQRARLHNAVPRPTPRQAPRAPPPPPPPPPEPERPQVVPAYCSTTSGSPDDLFSVYLSAKQQLDKCFVNMQIDNHCLKLRLPARPKSTGMVFAQVTRRAMEPLCQITVGSNVFVPPSAGGPAMPAARPAPKSRQAAAAAAAVAAAAAAAAPARQTHPCSKCSQSFTSVEQLNSHFQVYHAGAVGMAQPSVGKRGVGTLITYDCPLCVNWSGSQPMLRQHIGTTHQARSKSGGYFCNVCSRNFPPSPFAWMNHVMTHARLKVTPAQPATPPARQSRRAAAAVSRARTAATAEGLFPCPNCDAVFADVSQFPEHWIQVHSSSAQQSPSKPQRPPAKQPPARRVAAEPRFSARPAPERAPAVAKTQVQAPTTGSSLRCTRCGDVFSNESAYAQHWINAHTKIRLSADQAAAADGRGRHSSRNSIVSADTPTTGAVATGGATVDNGAPAGRHEGAAEAADVVMEVEEDAAVEAADAQTEAVDAPIGAADAALETVDAPMETVDDAQMETVDDAAAVAEDDAGELPPDADPAPVEPHEAAASAADGGMHEPTLDTSGLLDLEASMAPEADAEPDDEQVLDGLPLPADQFQLSEESLDTMLQNMQ